MIAADIPSAAEPGAGPAPTPDTAQRAGLLACHVCYLVSRPRRATSGWSCPRCGTRVRPRDRTGLIRCWALLISAYVLYVPANVLPIMDTSSLFDAQRDTIFSGVTYLWSTGSWPTALIVLTASILVPLLKLLVLTFLLITVHLRSRWRPRLRVKLFRLIKAAGVWSMLDIYVVALLVALVHFRTLAEIQAGPAAIAFGAVVVLTLLAAENLDPRLLWDDIGPGDA